MENLSWKLENDTLVLSLIGNVDSTNAPALEKEIDALRASHPADAVTVDCEKLNYISSAGLRVILRIKKSAGKLTVVNVSPEVYEIFDMTGFTEMIEIHKAYRVLSVEGCEVIGQGANGKVYRIDPDTIVKAYLNPDALPEIHRERELARTAFVLGVPTAIPYDVVRLSGGGYGSVFELLNATSYAKLLAGGQKTAEEIAVMSIDLLKLIHGTEVKPESMPDMKQIAQGWANELEGLLDAPLLEKLRALIDAVPDDNHMLHGDYHIKNVMYQNGESLLIDMDTLCHGHPIFELGSIYNAYVGFLALDHSVADRFLGIPYETATELWNRELRLYLDGADEDKVREVERKAILIGNARICRRAHRRGETDMYEYSRSILEDLIPQIDTLTF